MTYPSDATFTLEHEVTEGVLNVTSTVDTPGNSDVLKVYIPSGTVERLDIAGGASMIHFTGQEDFLTTCNIDVALATVTLENIYTAGLAVNNSLLGERPAVSPNEKYVVSVENSVGGINIHGAV